MVLVVPYTYNRGGVFKMTVSGDEEGQGRRGRGDVRHARHAVFHHTLASLRTTDVRTGARDGDREPERGQAQPRDDLPGVEGPRRTRPDRGEPAGSKLRLRPHFGREGHAGEVDGVLREGLRRHLQRAAAGLAGNSEGQDEALPRRTLSRGVRPAPGWERTLARD